MPDPLNKRFQDLCQRQLSPDTNFDADSVYRDLLCHYGSTGRHYHNLSHLRHCLRQLDFAVPLMPSADAVEMALWFHDAVYASGKADNEQRSAELFMHNAASHFSGDFKEKVRALILATTHKDLPKDEDECFIVDIDLSSFGSNWNDFLIDTKNLRKEQPGLPDQAYFQAHSRFLKFLLARKRIFHSDFFYVRYERIAKQNIERLLADPEYQSCD